MMASKMDDPKQTRPGQAEIHALLNSLPPAAFNDAEAIGKGMMDIAVKYKLAPD
jgi:hypothetical protein